MGRGEGETSGRGRWGVGEGGRPEEVGGGGRGRREEGGGRREREEGRGGKVNGRARHRGGKISDSGMLENNYLLD